ncbi:MAG TPA: hypothetical protein PKI49_12345 [Pseudomonadota bacterium]|nr:hypothetical protein [Pseudomonadota bacterium]HNI61758.1 hypothetical protein [Pseudomonadota bacterium]HNK44752.1 hypothetical protein [Pseudomonadota bacterium]HNN54016.1 hypothetical protein [Pseudomonadota bacterium]HNO69295.1 hypothetical protein [Pseudomonadota bacterium]
MKDRLTKKQLSVSMYDRGMNVVAIAKLLRCEPSYVANALIDQGRVPAYVDLYTSTGPQNEDAKELEGVLKFTDAASARDSVAKIEKLWQRFSAERNRRGMHQCEVVALIGRNRAIGIGKHVEAQVFADWLLERLRSPATKNPSPKAA